MRDGAHVRTWTLWAEFQYSPSPLFTSRMEDDGQQEES